MIIPGLNNGKKTCIRHWSKHSDAHAAQLAAGKPLFEDALALKKRFIAWTKDEVYADGTLRTTCKDRCYKYNP
jgi:hypothetical protein